MDACFMQQYLLWLKIRTVEPYSKSVFRPNGNAKPGHVLDHGVLVEFDPELRDCQHCVKLVHCSCPGRRLQPDSGGNRIIRVDPGELM